MKTKEMSLEQIKSNDDENHSARIKQVQLMFKRVKEAPKTKEELENKSSVYGWLH